LKIFGNIINIFCCRFNSSLYHNYWENNYKLKLMLHSAHSSPPVFSEVRVPRSLVLCVCFVYRYFVLLAFVFWPLCWANQGNKNVDFLLMNMTRSCNDLHLSKSVDFLLMNMTRSCNDLHLSKSVDFLLMNMTRSCNDI
jgi:hypothetical protein